MSEVKQALRQHAANGEFSFALESEKVKLAQTSGGGSGGKTEAIEPQEQEINNRRELVQSDPHLGEGIETLLDFLMGAGFNVAPRNIPGTDAQLKIGDIANVKQMVETADTHTTLNDWVKRAMVDGIGYIEINWIDQEVFKPKLVPAEFVTPHKNEYGEIVKYEVEPPGGGGDPVKLGKYDMAHLYFDWLPTENFPRALVQRVSEQTDILRDMEIDMARFVATKAYPPILWKLGTENEEWNPSQIQGWLDEVSQVEPDTMLAAPHDVEAEAVGVGDNQSTQGAMDLNPVFDHFQSRIATGLGLPYFMLNGEGNSRTNQLLTDIFDRRVKRIRGKIRDAIESQILHSLYYHENPEENEGQLVPRFEFGEHSSEEERLEVDQALKLFNNGFLKREAFAQRVGIDPETEMPSIEELQSNIMPVIQQLAGSGDNIQNPDGGSPTDTGGGAESAGGEAQTRDDPSSDNSGDDDRNGRGSAAN